MSNFVSIKFQHRFYNFLKILTSLSTVFIKAHIRFYNLAVASKMAVSHFAFYPCGALIL